MKEAITTTTSRSATGERTAFNDLLALYADANGRPATPLQARSLRELVDDIDRARGSGQGVDWLRQAIHEAAEAGSGYLAPRRLRRICERWLREGRPDRAENRKAQSAYSSRTEMHSSDADWQALPAESWAAARDQLAGTLSAANFRAFIAESRPIGRSGNRVCLAVPDDLTAQRLTGPLRSPVEAAFAAALGEPARLECRVVRRSSPGGGEGGEMVAGAPAGEPADRRGRKDADEGANA